MNYYTVTEGHICESFKKQYDMMDWISLKNLCKAKHGKIFFHTIYENIYMHIRKKETTEGHLDKYNLDFRRIRSKWIFVKCSVKNRLKLLRNKNYSLSDEGMKKSKKTTCVWCGNERAGYTKKEHPEEYWCNKECYDYSMKFRTRGGYFFEN